MNPISFLGVPIDPLTMEEAVAACVAIVERREDRTRTLAYVNPHSLVRAHADPAVRDALTSSDIRLADGAGLMLVGRLRGAAPPSRIPAPDFVPRLTEALDRRGGARYFFYGSTDEVLDRLRVSVPAAWPGIQVVGALAPPFRPMTDEEEAAHVAIINAAGPDVLWVGMTAPKQECWVHRNRHRLRVPLVGSVGAAFDFLAGTKRRSPRWARRMGLEWLHRLALEPARLWERTFVSAPLFLWYSLLESLGPGRAGPR
jgi:N-acetylglucosaminyldiphosphoundecaprenol N-acetyl-beta-D-mannosaminyltransferase